MKHCSNKTIKKRTAEEANEQDMLLLCCVGDTTQHPCTLTLSWKSCTGCATYRLFIHCFSWADSRKKRVPYTFYVKRDWSNLSYRETWLKLLFFRDCQFQDLFTSTWKHIFNLNVTRERRVELDAIGWIISCSWLNYQFFQCSGI